jgi:hypothetical protein
MRHVNLLVVDYKDEQGQAQTVSIPDRFELSSKQLHDLLRGWNKDLVGEWGDPHSESMIRFDTDSGVLLGSGSSEIHFRWRHVGAAAIEVEPAPGSDESIEAGLYHYEITAGHGSFELRFFEGFPVRRLSQSSKAASPGTGIDPRRLIGRIEASEPLGKLGPTGS